MIQTYDVFMLVPVTFRVQTTAIDDPERHAEAAAHERMNAFESPTIMIGHTTTRTIELVSPAEIAAWGALILSDEDATLRDAYYDFKTPAELGFE